MRHKIDAAMYIQAMAGAGWSVRFSRDQIMRWRIDLVKETKHGKIELAPAVAADFNDVVYEAMQEVSRNCKFVRDMSATRLAAV